MYVPKANAMDDPDVTAFLAAHAAAHLVTVGPDGHPDSTLLPVIVDGDRVIGHLARANDHWTRIKPASPGLVVVSGADAYVSPGWYASRPSMGVWCRRGTTARCSCGAPSRSTTTRTGCSTWSRGSPSGTRQTVGSLGPSAMRRRSTSVAGCAPLSASRSPSSRSRARRS